MKPVSDLIIFTYSQENINLVIYKGEGQTQHLKTLPIANLNN